MSVSDWKDYKRAINKVQSATSKAAKDAVKESATNAVSAAKSAIQGSGLGSRWAGNQTKPAGGVAYKVFNSFNIASVFERGTTISGKPLLWLPLDNVPKGDSNGSPRSPHQLQQRLWGGQHT